MKILHPPNTLQEQPSAIASHFFTSNKIYEHKTTENGGVRPSA